MTEVLQGWQLTDIALVISGVLVAWGFFLPKVLVRIKPRPDWIFLKRTLRVILGIQAQLSESIAFRRTLIATFLAESEFVNRQRSLLGTAGIRLEQLDPGLLVRTLREKRLVVITGAVGTGEDSYLTAIFRDLLETGHKGFVPVLIQVKPNEAPLDRVRREFTRFGVTDPALIDLLLRKGPILFLIDGLDGLTTDEASLWLKFGEIHSSKNQFCLALSRPTRKLDFPEIQVPRVSSARVRELIEKEFAKTPYAPVPDYPPGILELLASPVLLAKILQRIPSEGARALLTSRTELLEFLLNDAFEIWYLGDSPRLLVNGVCEAAFRSVLYGSLTFESQSLPDHVAEDLIRAGFLVRRGESRIEYGHELIRSFLAAKYFTPRWQRLLEVEGRDLDPASSTAMLELAIEMAASDKVDVLTRTIARRNPPVASALLNGLELSPTGAVNLSRAASLLREEARDVIEPRSRVPGTVEENRWTRWFSERTPDSSLIGELPRPGHGYPAIRVRRLRLHNIKCFRDLDYDFRATNDDADTSELPQSDSGQARLITVMVGENSTGKSTILQAIALGCLGPAMANQTEGFRARDLLRRGAEAGSIELELDLITDEASEPGSQVVHVGLGLRSEEEDFYALTDREMVLGTRNHAEHVGALRRRVGFDWGLCVGYGAFRALKNPESGLSQSGTIKAAAERVMSMFVRSTTLMHPEALERLLYEGDASAFSTDAPQVARSRRDEIIRGISNAIPGLTARSEDNQLRLVEAVRDVTDLSQLSDGPNSLVALFAHLIRHALQITGWEDSPFEALGIVLIDEVDLHLHPVWQRQVLSWLSSAFPRMQIIATTHSPLVLGGIPDGQVHLLRQTSDGSVELRYDLPSVKGWEADQILTSLHFGVSSTYDVETEELLSEYVELMIEPGDHAERMQELDGLLRERRPQDQEVTELDAEVWHLFLEFARSRMADLSEQKQKDFATKILSTLGSQESSQ